MQNPGSEGKYSSDTNLILIWFPLEICLLGTVLEPHQRPKTVPSLGSSISTKSYLNKKKKKKVKVYLLAKILF